VSAKRTPAAIWHKVWHAFDGLAGDTLWSGAHDLTHLITATTSFLLLQQSLEVEQYGAYIGLYGLVGTFGAMTYAGVGLALLQRLLGERDDPDGSLRSFLSLAALLGVVASVLVVVLGPIWLRLTSVEIALLVVAELLCVAIVFVSAMLVQAASGFPAATRVKMAVIVFRLLVTVTLYSTGNLTIRNLAAGFCILFALYAIYLLQFHLPRHGYRVSFGRPGPIAIRASTMFSIPMGASKLQTDGDKFLLNAFRHGFDAGLYGAAYRVVQLGTLPLLALDTAAFQRFLPQGEGERGLHWRRASKLSLFMLGASTVVAAGIYLMLPLLDFLFEEKYKEAVDIVPWLLLLVPLIATSNSPMNGLLGLGLPGKRMLVYLSSAVVSLVAYVLLIPELSWQGAAVATFISEIYLSASGWTALWYYQRKADRAASCEVPPASPPVMTTV
jgi:O-antigen/teichoic acid export membrane protein